jgi:acetyl esterase/lipase
VFVPDYRLAPAHPFPAALEDALAAYQYVRALRPKLPVLISGDSAGGGLALSLLIQLRDANVRMPDGAVLLSPWTDLSASGASLDRNRRADVWLSRAHLETWGRYYAEGTHARDPRVSPVFADLRALPPLLILVGAHEVLLDDALRVADSARSAGTPVDVHVGPRMQHDWPLTLPWLDESRRAWAAIRDFVDARCAPSSASAFPGTAPSSQLEHVS